MNERWDVVGGPERPGSAPTRGASAAARAAAARAAAARTARPAAASERAAAQTTRRPPPGLVGLAALAATACAGGAASCTDGYDPPPPVIVWCPDAAAAGEAAFHVELNVQTGAVLDVPDVPRGSACTPEIEGTGTVDYDADRRRVTVSLTIVNRTDAPVRNLAALVRFVGDDDGVTMHMPRPDTAASFVAPGGWRAFPARPATLAPDESGTVDVVLRVPAAVYTTGIGGATIDATGGYRVEIAGGVAALAPPDPGDPAAGPAPYLLIEGEDFHPGPAGYWGDVDGWEWTAVVNGASGSGVLDAPGLASAPACTTITAPAPGVHRVWARTGGADVVPPGAEGSVIVEVDGAAVGMAGGDGGPGAWSWSDVGTVDLPAGPATLCLRDGGGDLSRTDALIFTPDADADPDALLAAGHQLSDPAAAHAAVEGTIAARLAPQDALAPPATLAEWDAMREDFRTALWEGLGLDFDHPDPGLPPETVDVADFGDYRLEKIRFYAHPDLPATALLYLPPESAGPGPFPAVLGPVGHWPAGKAYGPEQERNVTLARLGYVALSIDPLNQGERVDPLNDHQLGQADYFVGDELGAVMVLEWMRALDWLVERPEVDPTRIAASGASGGGTITLYLAALDDRIAAAAPAVAVGTWNNIMIRGPGGDAEQYPWGNAAWLPTWGLLALAAPKPVLVISASGDTNYPAADAAAVAAEAAPVWGLYGADADFTFDVFSGPHNFERVRREAFYTWLEGVFRGDTTPVLETPVEPLEASALEVGLGPSPATALGLLADEAAALPPLPVPADAAAAGAAAAETRATLAALWGAPPGDGAAAPAVTALGEDPAGARGVVRERLMIESEPASSDEPLGYAFEAELYRPLGWPGAGGRGAAVVYLSDGGKESAVHVPALLARGLAVLAIDARITGSMLPGMYDRQIARTSGYAGVGLAESVAGWRLADTYAALRALAARDDVDPARLGVVGGGLECAPVALAAAALDPLVRAAGLDLGPASLRAMVVAAQMMPPGLVTHGLLATLDVAAIAGAAAPKPLVFVRTRDADGAPAAPETLASAFASARAAYAALDAPDALDLLAPAPAAPGAALADFLAAALAP